jgi:DNA-binding response OmpR family regulator
MDISFTEKKARMKKRLLIVDDEKAVRMLLSRILTKAGHDCSVAENALVRPRAAEDKPLRSNSV